MRLIELHILQSFPVSCLNRDEVGSPKTAIFGGVQRARISSQCLKRAIRLRAMEENKETFRGSRTRKAAADLAQALIDTHGWPEDEAHKTAESVCHLLLNKNLPKSKRGTKSQVPPEAETSQESTSTLLYFSPQEVQKMAQAIHEAKASGKGETDFKRLKDAAVAALGKTLPKDAADIALFGRMVANAPDLTLEGAAMFSHALSTHEAANDLDFFAAVDDQKSVAEDAGAGMIGTNEFTSATYYRYIAVNLEMLADANHLKALTVEERRDVMRTFLRASLLALPDKGRKNSMNAWVLPSYVLGIVKLKGQPIQLVNAFERPVRPTAGGFIQPSTEELKKHYAELKKLWKIEAALEIELPPADIDTFCDKLVEHVV